MEALSALRKAFCLKKNEEVGKKFDPITLKRITDAMKDYAAVKNREQRSICQAAFDEAYSANDSDLLIIQMHDLNELQECESPELD